MKFNKPEKIIACIVVFTILIQSYMDLNSTHMTNPLWAPHARFHWSIQYFSSIILHLISLYLLLGNYEGKKSRLSFVFAASAPLLFWGMFFPALMMPGTSAWQDGMEPFLFIAPNVLVAVVICSLTLWAIRLDRLSRLAAKTLSYP